MCGLISLLKACNINIKDVCVPSGLDPIRNSGASPRSFPAVRYASNEHSQRGNYEKNLAEEETSTRRYAMMDRTMPPSSHKTVQELLEALDSGLHISLHSPCSIISFARKRLRPTETVHTQTWKIKHHPFSSSAAVRIVNPNAECGRQECGGAGVTRSENLPTLGFYSSHPARGDLQPFPDA